jgi:hypothetical protein
MPDEPAADDVVRVVAQDANTSIAPVISEARERLIREIALSMEGFREGRNNVD